MIEKMDVELLSTDILTDVQESWERIFDEPEEVLVNRLLSRINVNAQDSEDSAEKELAVAVVRSMIPTLVSLRDQADIMLSLESLTEFLTVEGILELADPENLDVTGVHRFAMTSLVQKLGLMQAVAMNRPPTRQESAPAHVACLLCRKALSDIIKGEKIRAVVTNIEPEDIAWSHDYFSLPGEDVLGEEY